MRYFTCQSIIIEPEHQLGRHQIVGVLSQQRPIRSIVRTHASLMRGDSHESIVVGVLCEASLVRESPSHERLSLELSLESHKKVPLLRLSRGWIS